jgi:crotonobetainyl-CoA:carnitine CoA-transferase CaiB-like acyl-CoA transferase
MTLSPTGPCSGLSVVELTAGTSELGLGLAGGLPGMILADLGAAVTRIVSSGSGGIDERLQWGRVWHRHKEVVTVDAPDTVRSLLLDADVALVYGPEALVERRGLGWQDVSHSKPALVYARLRPSRTCTGQLDDFALLVEARSGFCTQLPGHRSGPTFVDVRAPGSGAAFLMLSSVFALLRRRALTGQGGWSETSLYDGMLATLGCMIGRSERGGPGIETYWEKGSWFPNFMYRCADGELIQVWFGGKGMYASLIEVLGDKPSEQGYYADQAAGRLNDRARRWASTFATLPREEWIGRLRAAGVACEPVLGPGDALRDPHLAETGLAVSEIREGHRDVVAATPLRVFPLVGGQSGRVAPPPLPDPPLPDPPLPDPPLPDGGLLSGLRVVDFSMFVAGPLAGQVLADLGADVVKVEPPQGEAMRGAAYAMAACQRGKRSLAIDLGAPEARPVVERLLRWADVVLHNFRVGVSERLGIDEATVARINPGAVYCHASAFGTSGPRASYPGNDALMQALTGFERAIGGKGNDPIAATWIPVDMCGGWMAASGILAALYARAATGTGQQVASSLLGSAMLLHSGVFERDGEMVHGPVLDGDQTGYGPGYRIYRCGDGQWLAVVLPDESSWATLRSQPEMAGLETSYAPLRVGDDEPAAIRAESLLSAGFASAPAAEWLERLRSVGVPAEVVAEMDRDGFRRGILDDPLNQQMGRVVAYETAQWGHFEQIGPLIRCGPAPTGSPAPMLPGIGEHSVSVLTDLGFSEEEVDALLAAKVVRE